MPNLTPQQQRAVDHRDSSVVLSSGAGCGKTHVLTTRYLAHLSDDEAEVGQVVAITFTERAAREMRGRIRSAVEKKLADLPPANAETAVERARWRRHLRALETAPITTIHGFCGSLLRQYSVPAGLDPHFEVHDEVLSANLRSEALQSSLHTLLARDPASTPAADLRALVVLFGWNALRESVDSLLLDADRSAWDGWLSRKPTDIAVDWLESRRKKLLPRWVEYLCAASPKVANGLTLLARVAPLNPEVAANMLRVREETPSLHEAANLAAAVTELAELTKVGRSGKKDWGETDAYETVKKALAGFRTDLPKRFDLFAAGQEGVAEAAAIGQRFLRVAAAAHDEYQTRKKRAGVLDFQDLLTFARDLLRDHFAVRAELHKRYQFVLVDELQDTDPVQMDLIEHLCGPGLTSGKLFAVGDHKQSIYRFRGADVDLFETLRQSIAEAGRQELSRNYRSRPGVLQFVNALFARRVRGYEPLMPHRAASETANVEFLWAEPSDGGQAAIEAEDAEAESSLRASAAECRRLEADAIARRILRLLDDPSPRAGRKEGVPRRASAKDVVLLFRSMSHVAIYETALRRHGLDYYLVGGRAFFAQQEVYDLLNVLRAIENPQDGASLVGALRSPFGNLSDEAVHLLATHPDGPWTGLFDENCFNSLPMDQRPHTERARRFLIRWRSLKDRLPIARLLGEIFADSGYDAAMQFEFLGDRKLANLWKLLDLAERFDRTGLFGLHEFTARLADLVARQPREEQAATLPEEADVVRLMSIHQAKGQQFPVVFVPDLAASNRGPIHPVARWDRDLGCLVRLPAEFETFAKEEGVPFSSFADRLGRTADQLADWEEDLRILYVACTRAEDLLILSAGLPEPLPAPVAGLPTFFPSKASNHWTLALAERFDPRTGQCLAKDVQSEDRPRVMVTIASGESHDPEGRIGADSREGVACIRGGEWLSEVSAARPRIVSLPALERLARGEDVASYGETVESDDDGDRPLWRTPRERLGPMTAVERVLWAVLERWPFADMDAWGQLLTDALEDVTDPIDADRIAEELRPKLEAFAKSDARFRLAGAHECRPAAEYLADLTAFGEGGDSFPLVRGLIDFLYRDSFGWHVLAIDAGTAEEDDPWRGRRPGLVLGAWAAAQVWGDWPVSIELYDLATGQLVDGDPRKVKPETVANHFRKVWANAFAQTFTKV